MTDESASQRVFFLLALFTTFLCRTVLCVAMVLYASFTATEEMQGGREGGAQFAAHQQATQRSRRAAILPYCAHGTDKELAGVFQSRNIPLRRTGNRLRIR